MTIFLISFLAGALTVLAPCILPLLPVIIGGSITSGEGERKPYTIITSLILSIVLFTLILKWSTALIGVPAELWSYISGSILVLLGLFMFFPGLWEKLPFVSKMNTGGNKLVGKGFQKKNFWGDVLIGAALGPVFSSCSPTYFVILATVLPESFIRGLFALFAYSLGLGIVLLLISIIGQRFVSKLDILANPRGWFKRGIGVLFVIVGIFVFSGLDKVVQTRLIEGGVYGNLSSFENKLIDQTINNEKESTDIEKTQEEIIFGENLTEESLGRFEEKSKKYDRYVEIVNPSGFVNTDGQSISISDYIGKKVILIDFMTYSCINCIRTFPYVNEWYDKYEDDGLIVIGIHTPEFAFEKDINNVTEALNDYGIKFPVVLDNDYSTWRAWENSFWPRKYLIDIDGFVVYDHAGEGAYEETEQKIIDLLEERATVLGESLSINETLVSSEKSTISGQSPETYFGSRRNSAYVDTNLGSCSVLLGCSFDYDANNISQNKFALFGDWQVFPEYLESKSTNSGFGFKFYSKKVFLVAGPSTTTSVAKVYIDGNIISDIDKGKDVVSGGTLTIDSQRLYEVVDLSSGPAIHTLEIKTTSGGNLDIYTLTFGV